MKSFKSAYNEVLEIEGSFVNDERDRGGMTYKGISRRHWPDWIGWSIVDNYIARYGKMKIESMNYMLDKNQGLQASVQDFYFKNFWLKADLKKLPEPLAREIFDTGVNQGLFTAVQYFQEALNLLNRNERDYPDLVVDGKMGPKTFKAFWDYMETGKWASRQPDVLLRTLVKVMNGFQFLRYKTIVDADPEQEVFFLGWIKRV